MPLSVDFFRPRLHSRRSFVVSATKALFAGQIATSIGSSNALVHTLEQDNYCENPITSTPTLRSFDSFNSAPVVSDQLYGGVLFQNTAVFDDKILEYVAFEYRQLIRGYIAYKEPKAPSWSCFALALRYGKILSPTLFQEDGIGTSAYGYRKTSGCSDSFGPGYDRAKGWLYTANDFPSFHDVEATEYQIRLEFCFGLVNTIDGTYALQQPMLISCGGSLPGIQVRPDLPKDPPAPPYWLQTERGNDFRLSFGDLKPLSSYGYAQIIVELRGPSTSLHFRVIRNNQTNPLHDQFITLLDSQGGSFRSVRIDGNQVPAARSAGTTTDATVNLSLAETRKLGAATLEINSIRVLFGPDDLRLR